MSFNKALLIICNLALKNCHFKIDLVVKVDSFIN